LLFDPLVYCDLAEGPYSSRLLQGVGLELFSLRCVNGNTVETVPKMGCRRRRRARPASLSASIGVCTVFGTMSLRNLIGIAWHACQRAYRDRVTMVAAGVAFFVLLAIFPGIAAVVSLYSTFADPEKGGTLLAALPEVLPEQQAAESSRDRPRASRNRKARQGALSSSGR
jgi:hypothetical protein